MVGGGNVQNLGSPQRFRPNAPAVHGHRDTFHTAGLINPGDFAVPRVFHRVDFVPAQELDEKIVQKVRSRADDKLIRMDLHPPESRQMLGDGQPQFRTSLGRQGEQ